MVRSAAAVATEIGTILKIELGELLFEITTPNINSIAGMPINTNVTYNNLPGTFPN